MSSDLHMHTTVSDGRLSPLELVAAAKQAGLAYMAITDHDSVDALLQLQAEGAFPDASIEIIPGVEFSAHVPGHEVHILGYGIDLFCPQLRERLDAVVKQRWTRFVKILENLRNLGFDISEAEVLAVAGTTKSIGRAHIAQVLLRKKYFATLGAAFADVLHKDGAAYVPHYRLEPREIVELVWAAGGVAVLAHPLLIGSDAVVERLIDLGIDGIEAFHPKHDEAACTRYKRLAERHRLLITGGSDYHAIPTRYPFQVGDFTVDDEYAILLKRRIGRC